MRGGKREERNEEERISVTCIPGTSLWRNSAFCEETNGQRPRRTGTPSGSTSSRNLGESEREREREHECACVRVCV